MNPRFYWFNTWGLGFAVSAHITCEQQDDDRTIRYWREYKIYVGPLLICGDLSAKPPQGKELLYERKPKNRIQGGPTMTTDSLNRLCLAGGILMALVIFLTCLIGGLLR